MKLFLALILLFVTYGFGCSSPQVPQTPEAADQTATAASVGPEHSLNGYAQSVVKSTNSNVYNPTPAVKSLDAPLSYVIKFHTADPALMSRDDWETNQVSHALNTALQEGWNRRFCTSQLKSVMAKHGIFSVSGHLLNAEGELQVFSPCMQ